MENNIKYKTFLLLDQIFVFNFEKIIPPTFSDWGIAAIC